MCTPRIPKEALPSFTQMRASTDEEPSAVPPVLLKFLDARQAGDPDLAAAVCTDDVMMSGPLGVFTGIEQVKYHAFSVPAQPPAQVLLALQKQPQLSSPTEAVYAREYEVAVGEESVVLRQEFVLRRDPTSGQEGLLCQIRFHRLPVWLRRVGM